MCHEKSSNAESPEGKSPKVLLTLGLSEHNPFFRSFFLFALHLCLATRTTLCPIFKFRTFFMALSLASLNLETSVQQLRKLESLTGYPAISTKNKLSTWVNTHVGKSSKKFQERFGFTRRQFYSATNAPESCRREWDQQVEPLTSFFKYGLEA